VATAASSPQPSTRTVPAASQSVSITIPAFNEEETLEEVVREALAAGDRLGAEYEVLVVDDGSGDRTGEIADRLADAHSQVRVVHHEANRGFSGAMQSCMRNARGDYVFLGPADGQARYEDIERFWEMTDRHDLLFSYRVGRGDALHRKLASWAWYTILRLLFGHRVPEFSSTFLFKRSTLDELSVDVRADASNFLPVLYLRAMYAGCRVGLVGTVQHERRAGQAKGSSISNTLRTLAEDLKLWWRMRVRRER
jgi:glycosyltransferase involved in cell wall biosynthesis